MRKISTTNENDTKLLEGIVAADSKVIVQVYDLALPAVIMWVRENSGTEADARDIFQEAMIALFQKLQKADFDLTCTLRSFLQIMCRNLWLTRLRNRKKTELKPMAVEEDVVLEEDILQLLETSERNQLFFKHFDQLEEKCKQILSWFFDKVPMAEIAKRLNTSLGYIKKRKFVCKSYLIKAVQNDPIFDELKENNGF